MAIAWFFKLVLGLCEENLSLQKMPVIAKLPGTLFRMLAVSDNCSKYAN